MVIETIRVRERVLRKRLEKRSGKESNINCREYNLAALEAKTS